MRKTLIAAFLAATALVGTAHAEVATYSIDPTHTFVTFEVTHFGTSTNRGRFDKKEGTVQFDKAAKTGKVELTLETGSILVIGAPMYNLSIPTTLKAWIDRIAVAGKTFQYTAAGAEGLLKGKKAFIASARGGVYSAGSPAAALEHQESYLTGLLAFLGVTDVTIVRAEGIAFGPEAKDAAIAKALQDIKAIAA